MTGDVDPVDPVTGGSVQSAWNSRTLPVDLCRHGVRRSHGTGATRRSSMAMMLLIMMISFRSDAMQFRDRKAKLAVLASN